MKGRTSFSVDGKNYRTPRSHDYESVVSHNLLSKSRETSNRKNANGDSIEDTRGVEMFFKGKIAEQPSAISSLLVGSHVLMCTDGIVLSP